MTITTMAPLDLVDRSVTVLRDGQAPSGAYIASPAFPQYEYGWLRDGAYCALAMDAAGEHDSARAFHRWVADVIEQRIERIDSIVEHLAAGDVLGGSDMLPTRYTLDGREEEHVDSWPNFQLDGYGTWLFALQQHLGAEPVGDFAPAVAAASRYLVASWNLPCFDYWEEFGDRRHTSTLAAIAAGLRSAGELSGDHGAARAAAEVMAFMREHCVAAGAFTKGPGDDRVDASLISIATPFALWPDDDSLVIATIERVRDELATATGGIRRYLGDTYYGGNPWIMLTAWLGWHDRRVGDQSRYEHTRDWILAHVSSGGTLAEQILGEPQAPVFVAEWTERWGAVADPLLWSHAKYVLMESEGSA